MSVVLTLYICNYLCILIAMAVPVRSSTDGRITMAFPKLNTQCLSSGTRVDTVAVQRLVAIEATIAIIEVAYSMTIVNYTSISICSDDHS
jgi:hypothetical protein